jgi:nitroreductase
MNKIILIASLLVLNIIGSTAQNKDSADIDITIAVDHMALQATELGLGTCWVCNFDVRQCSDILRLPRHIEPVVLLPVGYPNIKPPAKKRKLLDGIVHWNKFQSL